ncbi:TonB-dependent receptor plug domain-containing protein [Romeria aff. gracilis LEGE 07310]|uniref:TonB-dependent receptor plug domain-containing protein n=2 Tax=Vasconcelosia TaxID=3366328 RepID=A0A8J7D9Y3_9CYAN|nr:TonB-dependent receptor plug domain-containing protein [Romeria aff. gracilis LEGE 07310]
MTLLLTSPVAARSNPVQLATSCLPGGADAPLTQGSIIAREQIERRSSTVRNLQDILTSEVPGYTSLGDRHPSLRGQPVTIFIDGVPVAADAELLSTLDSDLVERIEVIPGSSLLCSGRA